ncbi:MAG: methyltransferase domain-containing protein [Anaerolineales bacterium]
MNTPASVFDNSMEKWLRDNGLPWMKLKTELGLSNLRKHLPGKSLRILDAGGGSGYDALPLARDGHRIDLVDYSAEMLKAARTDAEREGLQETMRFHQADVLDLDQLFPQSVFGAVVCHNVLQFVGDVPRLLSILSHALALGGILSLISPNRHSLPYRKAFLDKDLDEAFRQIGSRTFRNMIFDTIMTEYSVDEIRDILPAAGLDFVAHYGIRCFADYWGDNETKLRPAVWEKIAKLEYALTDKEPYNLLARFWQIIARKP